MKTDSIRRAIDLRKTLIREGIAGREALMTDYTNTLQGKDT